jgi:hypothetical protein
VLRLTLMDPWARRLYLRYKLADAVPGLSRLLLGARTALRNAMLSRICRYRAFVAGLFSPRRDLHPATFNLVLLEGRHGVTVTLAARIGLTIHQAVRIRNVYLAFLQKSPLPLVVGRSRGNTFLRAVGGTRFPGGHDPATVKVLMIGTVRQTGIALKPVPKTISVHGIHLMYRTDERAPATVMVLPGPALAAGAKEAIRHWSIRQPIRWQTILPASEGSVRDINIKRAKRWGSVSTIRPAQGLDRWHPSTGAPMVQDALLRPAKAIYVLATQRLHTARLVADMVQPGQQRLQVYRTLVFKRDMEIRRQRHEIHVPANLPAPARPLSLEVIHHRVRQVEAQLDPGQLTKILSGPFVQCVERTIEERLEQRFKLNSLYTRRLREHIASELYHQVVLERERLRGV